MPSVRAARGETGLVRAIGVRALSASIVNATIGAGIFVLPAVVAAHIGAAAPLAYLVCGVTMGLIVTCFAMAGSRVSATGGVYAYVEVAFGPFVGFLAGVLYWLSAVMGSAGIAAALVESVGLVVPAVNPPLGRLAFLALIFAALAALNVRGVRTGARVVELVTLAKLAPLALFVAAGVFFVPPSALAWPGTPASAALGETVLLLVFAFVGIEVALVPSGEVKSPERTVPRAIFLALATTTILYMAVQFVAQGVLGARLGQSSDAPLADAAAVFLGHTGRLLVLAGAMVSMFGYLSGDVLSTPRLLFAFGRDGWLPGVFARLHARYRTPAVAIVAHAILLCGLAMIGNFGQLALISNVSVLSLYMLCCAGAWELSRRDVRAGGPPFTLPGGRVIPVLGCCAIAWILAHATAAEFAVEGAVVVVATVLFALRRHAVLRRGPS
jgi:amino acid transporter